jgi:hypothetical protein
MQEVGAVSRIIKLCISGCVGPGRADYRGEAEATRGESEADLGLWLLGLRPLLLGLRLRSLLLLGLLLRSRCIHAGQESRVGSTAARQAKSVACAT